MYHEIQLHLPFRRLNPIHFAVLAALACAAPAFAQNCNLTVGSGVTVTTGCNATAGNQLVVQAGGTLTQSNFALETVEVNGVAMTSIINAGTIRNNFPTGNAHNSIFVENGGSIDSITNTATGVIARAINVKNGAGGRVGTIDNSGNIFGVDGSAVHIGGGPTTSIVNRSTGLISGYGGGIRVNTAGTVVSIDNSGTLRDTFNGALGGASNGAFSINGGTVTTLTNSGTLSRGANTLAVNVTGGGTLTNLVIAGNDTAVFDGQVFATGTATRIASDATYTLKAADDFRVASFTNQGTAKLAAGTTFTLANVTGNTFANQGVFEVVGAGTANLTGGYSQTAAGTFRISVTNDTTFGKLAASGTVTLPSNARIDVNVADPSFIFTASTLSSVISAGTLLTSDGTFAVTDNSLMFNYGAVKNGNAVDLTIAAAASAVLTSVTNQGNTPGVPVAKVLDEVIASAPTGPLATPFVGLTTEQQVSNAVSQVLPLLTGGSQVAASAAFTGINRVVQARIESNRGLSSGDQFYGDKKFWMKPFGSWADQNDRKGVSGFSARTGGLAFGADAIVSDTTRLGLSFAYAKAGVDGNSSVAPNNAKVDVYHLLGYGSYALDADTDINFLAGIGQNKNHGRRSILFAGTTAKADYTSLAATFGAGIGRIYKLNDQTSFTPSVRADYRWIKDQGYTETGAGALNLGVNGRTTDELILAVDGKITHELKPGTTLTANLGLGYDVLNEQSSITAAFAGAPGAAFVTRGLDPSPWMIRGGLGIVSTTQSGMEVTARYDLEHRSDFLNQTASVKLRWAF